MSLIHLPRRRNPQPQGSVRINYNGLGKGLKMLFIPSLGAIDVVTGRVWSKNGDVTTGGDTRGRVFNFDGTDDYLSFTGYPELTSNTGTLFFWCPTVGGPDGFGCVLIGSSSPSVFAPQVLGTGAISIPGPGASTGTIPWFNSSNSCIALSYGGTAATMKAYFNGKDSGLTWSGTDPNAWGAGNKTINLGRYPGGNTWDFSGSMLIAGWTDSVWGEAEARKFYLDPFSLLVSQNRSIFFPDSVVAPPPAGGFGFVKVAGSWKTLSGTYVKVAGVWKSGHFFPNVSGSWKTLV